VLQVKAVVVDVELALVVVVDKLAQKAAQADHATALPLHAVADLLKAHALIAKIAAKEILMDHHQIVLMSEVIVATIVPMTGPTTATWTETMTVAHVVMNCHVTSTHS
jgi:hypothetical protein